MRVRCRDNWCRYSTADARFAWRATRELELSVVGQNLLQPFHSEFGGDPGPLVESGETPI